MFEACRLSLAQDLGGGLPSARGPGAADPGVEAGGPKGGGAARWPVRHTWAELRPAFHFFGASGLVGGAVNHGLMAHM